MQLTMEPGASVAEIARAHGANANQVFKWRRLFESGQLLDEGASSTSLLPVTIAAGVETASRQADRHAETMISSGGAIHIEFPGRAMISVEILRNIVRPVAESIGIKR